MVNSNTNAVLSYAIYMANMWSYNEAIKIFGQSLGEHIWNKWVSYHNDMNANAASMRLVYELDMENLKKLVEYACNHYVGRMNLTPGKYYIAIVKVNDYDSDKTENWIFEKAAYDKNNSDTHYLTSNSSSMCLEKDAWGEYHVFNTKGYVTCDEDVVDIYPANDDEIVLFKNELLK